MAEPFKPGLGKFLFSICLFSLFVVFVSAQPQSFFSSMPTTGIQTLINFTSTQYIKAVVPTVTCGTLLGGTCGILISALPPSGTPPNWGGFGAGSYSPNDGYVICSIVSNNPPAPPGLYTFTPSCPGYELIVQPGWSLISQGFFDTGVTAVWSITASTSVSSSNLQQVNITNAILPVSLSGSPMDVTVLNEVDVNLAHIQHIQPSDATVGNGTIPVTAPYGNAVVVTIDGSLRPTEIYLNDYVLETVIERSGVGTTTVNYTDSFNATASISQVYSHQDSYFLYRSQTFAATVTSPPGYIMFGAFFSVTPYISNSLVFSGTCYASCPMLIYCSNASPVIQADSYFLMRTTPKTGTTLTFTTGPILLPYSGGYTFCNAEPDNSGGGSCSLIAADYCAFQFSVRNNTMTTAIGLSGPVAVQNLGCIGFACNTLQVNGAVDVNNPFLTVTGTVSVENVGCAGVACQRLLTDTNIVQTTINAVPLAVTGYTGVGSTTMPVSLSGTNAVSVSNRLNILWDATTQAAGSDSYVRTVNTVPTVIDLGNTTLNVSVVNGFYSTPYESGPPSLWQYPFTIARHLAEFVDYGDEENSKSWSFEKWFKNKLGR